MQTELLLVLIYGPKDLLYVEQRSVCLDCLQDISETVIPPQTPSCCPLVPLRCVRQHTVTGMLLACSVGIAEETASLNVAIFPN